MATSDIRAKKLTSLGNSAPLSFSGSLEWVTQNYSNGLARNPMETGPTI